MKKCKRWEIAICIALIASVLISTVTAADGNLSDKLVRLHVVAQSDSEEDQSLKLAVRDRALELLSAPLDGVTDVSSAKGIIRENIPMLEEELNEFILKRGFSSAVTVTLEREPFPTREYATFSLPAGPYDALRIVIGDGAGQNWWCVVFPPLCAAGAIEDAPALGLDGEDLSLITKPDGGYTVKFKIAEWFGAIKNFFFGK